MNSDAFTYKSKQDGKDSDTVIDGNHGADTGMNDSSNGAELPMHSSASAAPSSPMSPPPPTSSDSELQQLPDTPLSKLSKSHLIDQIHSLEANLQKSAQYGSSLLKQLKSLQRKQAKLKKLHKNESSSHDGMRMQQTLLEDQLEDFRDKVKQMNLSNMEKENQIDKLTEQLHLVTIESESQQEKIVRFREMMKSLERERDGLLEEKQRQLSEHRHSLRQLAQEKSDWRSKFESLQIKLQQIRSTNDEPKITHTHEQTSSDEQKDKQKQERELYRLRQELDEMHNRFVQIQQEKLVLSSRNDSLKQQLVESVSILNTTKTQFRQFVEKVSGVSVLAQMETHSRNQTGGGTVSRDNSTAAGPQEEQQEVSAVKKLATDLQSCESGDKKMKKSSSTTDFSPQIPLYPSSQSSSLKNLELEVLFIPEFLKQVKQVIHTIQTAQVNFPAQLENITATEFSQTKSVENLDDFVIGANQKLSKLEHDTLDKLEASLNSFSEKNAEESSGTSFPSVPNSPMSELAHYFLSVLRKLIDCTVESNNALLQNMRQNMKLVHYKDLTAELQYEVNSNLQVQNKEESDSNGKHSQTISKLRQKISSLEVDFQKQFTVKEEEILSLRRNLRGLREKKNQKIKSLQEQLQEFKEKNIRLETMNQQFSQNETQLHAKMKSTLEENMSLSTKISHLEDSIRSHREQMDEMQKQLAHRDGIIEKHLSTQQEYQTRINTLTENQYQKSDTTGREAYRKKYTNLVDQVVHNKCKILNYSMMRTLNHLRNQLQDLRQEKATHSQQVQQLTQEIYSLREKNAQQSLQNAALCSSLDDLESAYYNLSRSRLEL